jgi:protein-tyrosine phosphatase
MDTPNWIKLNDIRIAIVPRPRGRDWLLDDLRRLKQHGIDTLVSLLTAEEASELGLSDEAHYCTEADINFLVFPIPDREVPNSVTEFSKFTTAVEDELKKDRGIGVHCRAGIGRSSLLVACLLVRNGYTTDAAFDTIALSRGCPVPDTPEQRQWVDRCARR